MSDNSTSEISTVLVQWFSSADVELFRENLVRAHPKLVRSSPWHSIQADVKTVARVAGAANSSILNRKEQEAGMSNDAYILSETRGRVAILTLNRPRILNAWSDADRTLFCDALRQCSVDEDIGAIVVTGAGDQAFCAGQDLNEGRELTKKTREESMAFWSRFRGFYELVRHIEKPIITALNGVAAGSGFQFTMLTDMVIGHSGARMGQTEINAGLGSITGTFLMSKSLGKSRAMELALSGRLMDGHELHQLGLVHRLVDQSQVLTEAVAVAAEWGAKAASAVSLTKRAFRQSTQDEFDRVWDLAIKYQSDLLKDKTTQDALSGFFTKRGHQ